MALVSRRSSALNPNAPLFIPAAFRQVEDFSPQWWELVKSSAWFRDYWSSQHKEEDFGESVDDTTVADTEIMLPEAVDLGIEGDFNFLQNEFEQLVLSSEAQGYPVADPNEGKKPVHDLDIDKDAKGLLKDLTIKSPKGRGPKSPAGPAKHLEKAAKYVNVKGVPQRIHQPR